MGKMHTKDSSLLKTDICVISIIFTLKFSGHNRHVQFELDYCVGAFCLSLCWRSFFSTRG